jgi:transposase
MDRILALDLGKNKTAARLRMADGRKDYCVVVPTKAADLKQLAENVQPTVVLMEMSTVTYWVHDLFAQMGTKVVVTANNSPCWKWKNTDCKSDSTDTDKLIKLYLLGELEPVHIPGMDTREWRSFIAFRRHQVQARTRIKNEIKSLLSAKHILISDAGADWTVRWVAAVREHAKALAQYQADELWRVRLLIMLKELDVYEEQINEIEVHLDKVAKQHVAVQLLQNEPGVGPRLAEIVVAAIDDPLRFHNSKQVACYAGLTPRHWNSGQTERSGHISKQGNTILRSLLVEVSWLAIRHNTWLKEIYERIRKDVKGRGKIAIVAAARRLLIKLWAIWRDFERERINRPMLAR